MWDWKGPSPASSTAASRNSSLHAGNAFKPSPTTSRNSSLRGGNLWNQLQAEAGGSPHDSKMRRNVSFSGNVPENAPSRESSQHGGNLFGGMRRTNSWVWDWMASSNPNSRDSSPNVSLHDKNNFGPGGKYAVDVKQEQGGGGGDMRRSLSFLWDWGKFRNSPVSTPGNSQHGGSNFAPEEEQTVGSHGGQLPYEIPKALTRGNSVGSFLWNWGWERSSPPRTPGNSSHGGNAFTPVEPATAQTAAVRTSPTE